MAPSINYSSLFLDFENVYYYLRPRLADVDDPTDLIVDLVRQLRDWIKTERGTPCIVQFAYADFDRIEGNALSELFLIGVDSRNVLGTEHKNAADMRLCIDALETLHTRPEIRTFVLVGGDRDYIPLVQHLRTHAREVLVCSFRPALSGDLLLNVGDENFVDASNHIAPKWRDQIQSVEVRLAQMETARREAPAQKPVTARAVVLPPKGSDFGTVRPIAGENQRRALGVLMADYSDKPEVWLRPYLFALAREFPELAEYERKALIGDLEGDGAIRIEKRPGEPNPYSVILINWEHPTVKELNPG